MVTQHITTVIQINTHGDTVHACDYANTQITMVTKYTHHHGNINTYMVIQHMRNTYMMCTISNQQQCKYIWRTNKGIHFEQGKTVLRTNAH